MAWWFCLMALMMAGLREHNSSPPSLGMMTRTNCSSFIISFTKFLTIVALFCAQTTPR